jgi:Domain of unknown function (DUF4157)
MPERLAHHQAEGRARAESRVRGGPRPAAPTAPDTAGQFLRLQRSFGNRAVWSLLTRPSGPVQPTAGDVAVRPGLPIAAPDSAAERDASVLAKGGLDPAALSRLAPAAPAAGMSLIPGSTGLTAAPKLRRDLEQRLGADLSGVRIHDDPASHAFTRSIGARAATWGSHVFFAAGRFRPDTATGREVLHHELIHTLQPAARSALHRAPDSEVRLPGQPVSVVTMSVAEYEALTGLSAAWLPEEPLPAAPIVLGPGAAAPPLAPGPAGQLSSAVPGGLGVGSLFVPQPNWYYRVLSIADPGAADIVGGVNLLPRPPNPGFTFTPARSAAEMTFRHTRGGGNALQLGTNRISTAADLEAVQNLLAGRGTGEVIRVDVEAARRLGAQFLEHGDIMAHLDEIGRDLARQLEAARSTGRGKNFVSRLEGRLQALEVARDYARAFQEGHGVGAIPSRAISPVAGADLASAVAGERAFLGNLRFVRYGGQVLLVVGAALSVERVLSAPSAQRGRVAAQEAGGWALSLGGAAAGAKAGGALGAALGWETGPGAVIAAALGSLIGGAIGFFGGQTAADKLYDLGESAARLPGQIVEGVDLLADPPRFIETSVWMFGKPQDVRDYYEMREIETGEPPPWEGL